MRLVLLTVLLSVPGCQITSTPAAPPPIYIWLEPEWFTDVRGRFDYWTGTAKPTGTWGIAGPGISAEWSQGGESGWNSIGAVAEETKAVCSRNIMVPRSGKYRVWVRYVDHLGKTEPFTLTITQGGKQSMHKELGVEPVVPANDEYQLYWGFSFGWAVVEGETLNCGPAKLTLTIDKAGQGWRHVDALLLTDDAAYVPVGRETPPFAYRTAFHLRPPAGSPSWRGDAIELKIGATWRPPPLGGLDFSMWTGIETEPKWWGQHKQPEQLRLYDVLFQFGPAADIREKFHQQLAGRKDLPILSWPGMRPGLYLGQTPDLSPGTPLRRWLEATKTPFYLLTNYSSPAYTPQSGPATYQALTGPLANQFLGYIHGETVGSPGVALPDKPLGATRREHIDALGKSLVRQQAQAWKGIFQTDVPEDHWSKGIPCLSTDSIALAHLFYETGAHVIGYEEDATMSHVPMRIAFARGAARQYGKTWINYASGNFGDACTSFFQQPVVPRGAPGWFHSKYAITDGVSVSWYRKLYYLNYHSGASAVFWEQYLHNQWLLPGPGTHPVQLSPFGRATEEFQMTISRVKDRGEPYTPVAFLLNYGHAYDRVNNHGKMLHVFPESAADVELRELFNVCWHPAPVLEGEPVRPDGQSMPGGVYGNIFDVLVDRPARTQAVFQYPVVWAAGDVELTGPWPAVLEEYVRRGGTLVVNAPAARGRLPEHLLGFALSGQTETYAVWQPQGRAALSCVPYRIERGQLRGAEVLAWAVPQVPLATRHRYGKGAVILTLVPGLVGLDERAHPCLPYLMNGVTDKLMPVSVRRSDGSPLQGDVLYQVNRTRDGYLILLLNTRGIDKTQSGIARVDRRVVAEVLLVTEVPIQAARELTGPKDLNVENTGQGKTLRLRIPAGDVQLVQLVSK
jgi:hypothetical protein